MEVIMKKKFATTFLTLATAFGFAQEARSEMLPTFAQREGLSKLSSIDEKIQSKSFGYLRMGVSDTELDKGDIKVLPGFGLGYRLNAGSSAIDFSAGFNRRKAILDEGREETFHYTVPKVNYLYYTNAQSNNSLYAGAGLAWGVVETRRVDSAEDKFMGIIPNIALGYELNRMGSLRSFVQLDVSQPAIAAVKEGAFPKPFAEISVGAGF